VARSRLSRDLTGDLQRLCAQHGLTLNTLVQGIWALLLGRYAGRTDVVLGSVVSGRPPELEGVEGMVGVFVNTLPLRLRIEPRQPAVDWLQGVQERLVAMRGFEHTALTDVRRWSGVPAGEPLFESLYAFENYPVQEMASASGEDAQGVGELISIERTNYAVTLAVSPGPRLAFQLIHHLGRLDEAAAGRLLDHLAVCLQGLAADPRRALDDLPWLTAAERRQALVDWNDTSSDYPRETSVEDLFRQCARERPDAVAVVHGDREMSYGELDRRSEGLALRLRRLGVGSEVPVAVCVERSPGMLVALLAILKAGGFYLPLDPDTPRQRIDFMLCDAGADLVLCDASTCAEVLPAEGRRVLSLDEWEAEAGAEPEEAAVRTGGPLPSAGGGERLAYVMYTSGSTGRPKGVAIPHRGVVRLVLGTDYLALAAGDRLGQAASIAFDGSTFEIWGALLNGATVVVIDLEIALSPPDLVAALQRHRVDTLWLTPALFNQVVAQRAEGLCSLRDLLVGGEALDPAWIRRLQEAGPPRRLLNVYGPTESTTFAVAGEIERMAEDAVSVPIGRPIANTTAWVLDRWLEPVPVGGRRRAVHRRRRPGAWLSPSPGDHGRALRTASPRLKPRRTPLPDRRPGAPAR
jgi:amino acid adenylation domain-containing protein